MTCRRQVPPKDKDKNDIDEEDYDYYKLDKDDKMETFYLQRAYCELAKRTYLPFLYGISITCVLNSQMYPIVSNHLSKVMHKKIDSPSDLSEIVEAVYSLSDKLMNSEVSNSRYIQSKVDQYILLSQGKHF